MRKLLIALSLVIAAAATSPPWSANISATVLQYNSSANTSTHAFGGSLQLFDVTVPGKPVLVQSWTLDKTGSAAAGVTLNPLRLYEIDLFNDSHKAPCPCQRQSRTIFPLLLPATNSVSTTIILDAAELPNGFRDYDDLQLHWSRIK